MDQIKLPQPIFEPHYLNLNFIFEKVYSVLKPIFDFIVNPNTWKIIGIILIIISIFFIAIIIFSLVRLFEMQTQEKLETNHKIEEMVKKENERRQRENPRWHHILDLNESQDESSWRMSIIEADAMLEESLKNKGIPGENVAELLEAARSNGYSHIQDIWNAHLIRNEIAHSGSKYSLSKIEAQRAIKMYRNFFEEIGAI